MVLAIAALAGIVLLILRHRGSHRLEDRLERKTRMSRVSLGVALFAAVFALQFGLGRLLGRFEADPADDLRIPLNITTFETALNALPFGTGLGSFVPVYATVEKSQDAVAGFANRAHDDLAELLLETGLPGAVLVLLFLAWFLRRTVTVWKTPQPENDPLQAMLQRASSLIVILLLLHSLVDYPLRTTALGAVFAFFCAILAAPVHAAQIDVTETRPRGEPRTRRQQIRTEAPSAEALSGDLAWPDSWTKKEDFN